MYFSHVIEGKKEQSKINCYRNIIVEIAINFLSDFSYRTYFSYEVNYYYVQRMKATFTVFLNHFLIPGSYYRYIFH